MVRGSKAAFSFGSPVSSGREPAAGVGSGARGVQRASTYAPQIYNDQFTSVNTLKPQVRALDGHSCTAAMHAALASGSQHPQ